MVFNDVTSSAGIVQDTNFWAKTNQTKYPLVDLARNANEWVKKVGLWIWEVAGEWEFDDKNLTTLPIGTATMVAGQQDYELPTNILRLERVQVMDANGNWTKLIPFDQSDLDQTALEEFQETSGLPVYYDVVGNSLMLYPAPAADKVTLDNGLEVMIGREIDPFTSADTTKEPGFSAYFHRIISLGCALDYARANTLADKIKDLQKAIYGDPAVPGDKGMKGELQAAYALRHNADLPARILPKRDDRI